MEIIKVTKVSVDFGQLLEDITYTNRVMKTFDVSDIITRNRYYEKDHIAHDKVVEHWRSIVGGKVPFGYEIVQ